jgi:hypothetical protein
MAGDYRWDYWTPSFEIEVPGPTLQYNRVTLNLNYAVTTANTAPPFSVSPEVAVVGGESEVGNEALAQM